MTDDLDDLLADLAAAATRAAAHGTLGGEAPAAVHRITARVRRRRAVRHTGQGVAVACAAGALVAGGAQVRGAMHAPPTAGPAQTGSDVDDLRIDTFAPAPSDPGTAADDGPRTDGPATTVPPGALASAVASAKADAEAQDRAAAEERARVERELRLGLGDPAAAIFRCGEPVHTTIHSRPDANGLLLAADDDLTAQVTGIAQLTWHAELPTAARYAIVGTDGTVVARLVEDDATRTRVDGTRPEQTYRLAGGVHVVGCEGKPDVTPGEKVVAWPYVSADVYKDASSTTGTPVVAIAEPREITVP
ncbi:hypothetical protein [Cellulomonas alba]|uniref:Uncharacterized protein n=1 Tax=Cellulomonas alba TaxID=3053467 RepID=A0ABT7SE57_9CELL|nr:hypothetical protein [Cellulomonas alba]MDM7854458.1 hypothetical protein [Cellulomonas alba]